MADAIRFLLDGEIISIRDVDPTRTVLQWLREDRLRTGTKEGCAEGDCGACMVVVADVADDGESLRYQAINSCIQFLSALDGKELITVESLSPAGGRLHPVQQAMVVHHGSQCGFCTPGFVMTLFAAYRSKPPLDRPATNDALAGNLCRCTGYRPIADAAEAMYTLGKDASGDERLTAAHGAMSETAIAEERRIIETLKSLQREDTLTIANAGREIHLPTTPEQLAATLAAHPDATMVAGGTDVGLWVTKQFRDMDQLIYMGGVKALQDITVLDDAIRIGAGVTFTEAMPTLVEHFPALEPLLRRFASPPVRNAATVGGNVANGSPIGDSMPAFIALNARVTLTSANGSRELPLESLYIDYMVNAIEPGEFVASIVIPKLNPNQTLAAYKLSKRFDQDISAVCAVFVATVDEGHCVSLRTGFGGMAAIPARAMQCEAAMTDVVLNEATVQTAMSALDQDFTPMTDMRASDSYRREAARNLLYRFFLALTEPEIDTEVYDYGR